MRKIAIIGPESTGKSTLCQQLAEHFNTLWCPEYAREYLLKNGTDYNYDDLLCIAKGQVAAEDEYTRQIKAGFSNMGFHGVKLANDEEMSSSPYPEQALLFIDTEMTVMKVWCEYVFGKCHAYILEQMTKRNYDLYLLCNVDLPWVKDELREYPDFRIRENLYEIYKGILTHQATPWVSIHGPYDERLQTAIAAVERLLAGEQSR